MGSPDPGMPRIAPGRATDIGAVNATITRLLGLAGGGRPQNVFTTLARHRRLFRRWLRFAAALMPGGRLPRRETELVILRVAHNCASAYEWSQHERVALSSGLTRDEIQHVRSTPDAFDWTPRERLMLRAVDELHAGRTISDELWVPLREALSEVELIELCMLIGHYEMLAMTLNALHVQPDPPPGRAGLAVMRVLARLRWRRAERRKVR